MNSLRVIAVILCVVFVGCVTPSAPIARSAADLHDWRARGRIAVSGVESGGSGSFTWAQRGAAAEIQMHGPIGIGSLRVSLTAESLRIKTGDGQEFEADAARDELAARLGASVPANELRYWLVGVAAPGDHEWLTNADSTTLVQHDWRIDYQRYAVTQGVRLPMKLVAESGAAKVRIVIDGWTLK